MSTTRDWMHRDEDWERASARAGPPLAGLILWALGLALTGLGAITLGRLFG